MRPADFRDYLALRAHLARPWGFLRMRGRPLEGPFADVPLREGGTVRLRAAPMDRHIFHRIFARDEYGLDEFGPGSLGTVIDIGAHAGFFALRVAPLAARVLCYEPVPENYELLVHNVGRFPHVRPHPLAVAGRRGTGRLLLSSNPSSHSMFPPGPDGRVGGIEVACVALADVFESNGVARCDLLKLDCEGAEYDILFSLPGELWSRIERVRMEFHAVGGKGEEWSGERLADHLVRHGHATRLEPSRRHPGKGHLFSVRRSA
ncbi:MAG TPA: FkbM family methyltransferase [Planctomycetota bacterium]|jgi:FkbM family methyltransferase|nr:FkbM family methyltransferase [Planctomycetota bacterium]